jgi:hypothetical protein
MEQIKKELERFLTEFDNSKRRRYYGLCIGDKVRYQSKVYEVCGYGFMNNNSVWIKSAEKEPFGVVAEWCERILNETNTETMQNTTFKDFIASQIYGVDCNNKDEFAWCWLALDKEVQNSYLYKVTNYQLTLEKDKEINTAYLNWKEHEISTYKQRHNTT